jgi:hypothetical protein
MFPDRWRVAPTAARTFHFLMGLALLVAALGEAVGGAWRVHAGELYPYRHLPGIPLYGVVGLSLEWAATALVGGALACGIAPRATVRLALIVAVVGITQRFSNHRALAVIVLAFAALDPWDPRSPDFSRRAHAGLSLVRVQLVIVYVAAAVAKIGSGFGSGDVLVRIMAMPRPLAAPLAWATIAVELAIPGLLLLSPRVGIAVVAVLHLAFAVALPETASFGLVMLAMAVLFTKAPGTEKSAGSETDRPAC